MDTDIQRLLLAHVEERYLVTEKNYIYGNDKLLGSDKVDMSLCITCWDLQYFIAMVHSCSCPAINDAHCAALTAFAIEGTTLKHDQLSSVFQHSCSWA